MYKCPPEQGAGVLYGKRQRPGSGNPFMVKAQTSDDIRQANRATDTVLDDLLVNADRMSIAYSLELRSPLLEPI